MIGYCRLSREMTLNLFAMAARKARGEMIREEEHLELTLHELPQKNTLFLGRPLLVVKREYTGRDKYQLAHDMLHTVLWVLYEHDLTIPMQGLLLTIEVNVIGLLYNDMIGTVYKAYPPIKSVYWGYVLQTARRLVYA